LEVPTKADERWVGISRGGASAEASEPSRLFQDGVADEVVGGLVGRRGFGAIEAFSKGIL